MSVCQYGRMLRGRELLYWRLVARPFSSVIIREKIFRADSGDFLMGLRGASRAIRLDRMTDEQLLDLRLCDLPLKIEHTLLARRAVRLSEESFTPDRVPGFAIPCYLAHPRLAKLERRQMLEVEGGTEKECMRIM